MPKYDVVVVGAGLAGLSAALQTAIAGKKTLLIEQHNLPGGCATSFVRGRFEFEPSLHELCDLGPVENPGDVRNLLDGFGVKLNILPTVGLNELKAYIMPVTALAIYPTAYITRLMRSSLLDVMGQDYMRTAKAKGVSSFKTLFKHALRNAILPIITYVGPMLAYLMTGSFVVEKIFTIPGLGREFVSSITNRDYTLIMATTIFLAVLMVVANVICDLLYKVVDPRIKYD